MKPFEIFKPGKHRAMSGETIEFSEDQVRATVEAYDPQVHEAPIVIGHPRHDAPAYGWARSLTYAESSLQAEAHQVNPDFAEMYRQGSFKKISASFYHPDSPNNPKPGVFYLRHIGFLGAQPPAIKGLKAAEFKEHEEGVVEFADWGERMSARLFRGVKNLLLGNGAFSKEAIEEALPEYALETVTEEALRDDDADPSYSESGSRKEKPTMLTEEQIKQKEQEISAREKALDDKEARFAELESREQKLTEKEQAARKAEIASFCDTLIQEGRLLPAHKEGMVAFMASLPHDQVVEFGEGDKAEKKPSLDFFQGFLQSLPEQVSFAEVGKGSGPPEFRHDFGESVDEGSLDLWQRAKQIQKSESISFNEALTKARTQE